MGYCHYWRRERELEPEAYAPILADFRQVVLALDNAGVRLAGPLGIDLPELSEIGIAFNGLSACEHVQNDEICIPFPDPTASGIGDSRDAISNELVIGVQLRHRACNGDCSYESFLFERTSDRPPDRDDPAWCWDYCKTGFRPYDLAVQCLLLIAKHHLRHRIEVSSGGTDNHWADAKRMCYLHLGYPLLEFYLDPEAGLIEPR